MFTGPLSSHQRQDRFCYELQPALRKLSDPCYELTKSPALAYLSSLHSSFNPSVKHCSSTNPMLIHPPLPPSRPVSTPNTIHHSHLTVCLPARLSESNPLPIDFVLDK